MYLHLWGNLFSYFCIKWLIIKKERGTQWIQSLEKHFFVVQTGLIFIRYLICSKFWHGGGTRAVLQKLGSILKQEKFQAFSLHLHYRLLTFFPDPIFIKQRHYTFCSCRGSFHALGDVVFQGSWGPFHLAAV